MHKRLLQLTLGLALSGGLLALLLRAIDTGAVMAALALMDARWILPAIGLHLFAMWVRSVLWQRLLPTPVSTFTLFQISLVGFSVSYLMPLRVGEFARAWLLARWRGVRYSTTLASLVAERVLDGLAVGAILLVALCFVAAPAYVLVLGLAVLGIFGALASVLILASWRVDLVSTMAGALSRRLPPALGARIERMAGGFASGLEPLRPWRVLPRLVTLSLAGWLCQFGVFYLLMLAFPIPASFAMALLGGGVANLATLLPSAPGSVGTFDAALIKVLMDVQGVSIENAAAYALVVHAVVVVPIVLLGALVLWRADLSLGQVISRMVNRTSTEPAQAFAPVLARTFGMERLDS